MKNFLGLVMIFATIGCGSPEETNEGSSPVRDQVLELPALELQMQFEDYYTESEFWEGVVEKRLVWSPDNSPPINVDWTQEAMAALDIMRSGMIEVIGFDVDGRVVVSGELRLEFDALTNNSGQKNLVISLRRQEYD